jgi:hypothetical protein
MIVHCFHFKGIVFEEIERVLSWQCLCCNYNNNATSIKSSYRIILRTETWVSMIGGFAAIAPNISHPDS